MSFDISTKQDPCTEIYFYVLNYVDYQESWLGKSIDKGTNKEIYWYGLTPDGSQSYNFYSLSQFINAKVFHGKNIKEIWDLIFITSIDGGNIEEIFSFYMR